jgi:hypothetical protein
MFEQLKSFVNRTIYPIQAAINDRLANPVPIDGRAHGSYSLMQAAENDSFINSVCIKPRENGRVSGPGRSLTSSDDLSFPVVGAPIGSLLYLC